MAEHPAETMRRAAARLRELAEPATDGPWRVSFIVGVHPVVDAPGHLVAETCQCPGQHHERPRADAEYIAAMHPPVALALAGWLEEEACRVTGPSAWCHECGGVYGQNCACWDGALSVAREILGEADHA